MHIKFVLPSLVEAKGQHWRSIKYSLFPPLGLATLAGYLRDSDSAEIVDEHVERLSTDDRPDLVAIETYVTSAKRCYALADHYRSQGVYVVLGGLHVTSLPEEGLAHADTIVVGPAEEAWPRFLADFRAGRPLRWYRSARRDLGEVPLPRRDLLKRRNYLVPNSIVVSRGCPHACDFCYKTSFFAGGRSFYTYSVDQALAEIEALQGRHLFFLDDNILGSVPFARQLFDEIRSMRRLWQGASTVASVLDTGLVESATASGLRSLFVGFESLSEEALARHGKSHNRRTDYEKAVRVLHEHGVMINASFVFGLDSDDPSVFDATVAWALQMGLETATFHILTPYPGTPLFERLDREGRILHRDWDLYDTRHLVFKHPVMSRETLEAGYWRAYERFYGWSSIVRSALHQNTWLATIRHLAYTSAWKKVDPFWSLLIKLKQLNGAIPLLETVLRGQHEHSRGRSGPETPGPDSYTSAADVSSRKSPTGAFSNRM